MSAVNLADAVVLLGGFPALSGAELSVERGETVLIAGPNGAGKSTLLHLCAGLLPLASGRGEVLGCDLRTDRASVRRRVGLLAHDSGLYAELSAAENLRLWARASRVEGADVPGALDRLGLPARLHDTTVSQLSAGQRRRVALAALVIRRPELWLLDEPHAALDSGGREIVNGIIAAAADAGAAVVLAAHDHGLPARTLSMIAGSITSEAAP